MFPWLKPENDNYGQQQQIKGQNRQENGFSAQGKIINRQNQSDQDLIKAQKIQYGKYDSATERKQDEKDFNSYNHSKSENRLNQDKYNPYYDNMLSHNLNGNSRSGRTRFEARNSTAKSPREGAGIDFQVDYKHRQLEQNKQSYKDYYRDNISVFQKNQNGITIQNNEDKKSRLQFQYQKQDQETGITGRMSQNQRASASPQQQKQDYANILKMQIEEKKELMMQRQKKEEENDFQNKNYKNRRDDYEERRENYENMYPPTQQEQKKQQGKKTVGFENQDDLNDNYRSEVDYESLANNNNNNKGFISPPLRFQQPAQRDYSNDYSKQNQQEQSPKFNRNQRGGQDGGNEPFSPPENKRQGYKKNPFQEDERRKWNNEENISQNLIGEMHSKDEREQQIKKQRELDHYKQLENEIMVKRGRRGSGNRDREYLPSKEKSMLEQLGDNFQRQQELQQQQKAEVAQDLQHQIKEKKRLQRIQKEKEDLLDRQYEEKVKAELSQLKVKYQSEMQGKQLEIKTLRTNLEKKKQEQIQQQGELVLSKSSKSPPKNKVENSPREQYDVIKSQEDDYSRMNKRGSTDDLDEKGNQSNNASQYDIHLQSRDIRQQKRHEDREKFRDSMFDQQQEYYANREVNKEWNPPSFWQYKEKKNMQDLSSLKDQLDMQTSLLQNDVQKIKQDVSVASEMKSQAFIDLENLKDSLRRQNMIENIKLRELKQNLGNLGYVQNDLLPSSMQNNQAGYGGSQLMGNQSLLQMSAKNMNTNTNLLNQSTFSQNLNYSQLGGQSNIYNNNFSSNKYGLQQTDILDKLVSSNVNAYRFEGNRLNNKPTTLDFKLEKRLNNVQLNKAEIQLLEVDNLLNNLRHGL